MAGGLELGDLWGPFQAKPVYDSMINITLLLSPPNIFYTMSIKDILYSVLDLILEDLNYYKKAIEWTIKVYFPNEQESVCVYVEISKILKAFLSN